MKKLITLAASVAIAATTMSSFAGDDAKATKEQTAKAPTFSQFDGDNDGYISLEESKKLQGLVAQFSDLDADKDKRLSRVEFLKFKISK